MKGLQGVLYGAFIGDAFALSTHWEYDTEKLLLEHGNLKDYKDPTRSLFHKGKRKGDFTHYGDQSLLLLRSISSTNGFRIQDFQTHWLSYMKHYDGYIDHASAETLRQLDLSSYSGSSSDELGGFVRSAPLIYYHFDDSRLMDMIAQQTMLTHNNHDLLDISQAMTRAILELVVSNPFEATIRQSLSTYPKWATILEGVLKRLHEDTIETVKDIGQSCSSQFAFPAALYIAIKYQDDFLKAMQMNVACGGDSAGRGMLIGMLLGAHLGFDHIPKHLVEGLNAYSAIETFADHRRL